MKTAILAALIMSLSACSGLRYVTVSTEFPKERCWHDRCHDHDRDRDDDHDKKRKHGKHKGHRH